MTGFAEGADGVTVQLASGGEERGDLLVGADGINSTVRSLKLHPWTKPRYAGYALWFGITRGWPSRSFCELDGPGTRFISFPVGDGESTGRRSRTRPRAPSPRPAGRRSLATSSCCSTAMPAGSTHRGADQATDMSAIYRREIVDRDPIKKWGSGRVTLLGDAAHAMTPNLGQGACQAIEDGVALTRCLAADATRSPPCAPTRPGGFHAPRPLCAAHA